MDNPADDPIRREILEYCGVRGHVVDFGCGQGYWHQALTDRGATIVAVDNVDGCLDEVRARGLSNVTTILSDNLADVPSNSADFILAIGLLQLQKRGDAWFDFFVHAQRILKPNGMVLFDVPTPRMPRHNFLRGEGFRNVPTNGWRFGLDRQLGWLLVWMRSSSRKPLVREGRYYAARPESIERLAAENGLVVEKPPSDLLSRTKIANYSGIFSPNPARPLYAWWLMRKA